MESLPLEVIEKILSPADISIRDAFSMLCTCRTMKHFIEFNQSLWKLKLSQTYVRAFVAYKERDATESVDWYYECKMSCFYEKVIKSELQKLMDTCYMKNELEFYDFKEFVALVQLNPICSLLIVDSLMKVLHSKYTFDDRDLTRKYYAEKVIRMMRQIIITNEWHSLLDADPQQQTLEKGAVLVAQWCQPTHDVTFEAIGHTFDNITEVAITMLTETNEKHPLLKATREERETWARFNIDNNKWSTKECLEIIKVLSHLIFKTFGFQCTQESYYEVENSYIDKVLERRKGIPATISVLYESVARRMGVKCQTITFPGHFLLRWYADYEVVPPLSQEVVHYIDIMNGGVLLSKSNCPRLSSDEHLLVVAKRVACVNEVVMKLASNLELANRQQTCLLGRQERLKSSLDLLHMLDPIDLNLLMQLIRYCIGLKMEVTRYLEEMQFYVEQGGISGALPYLERARMFTMEVVDFQNSHQEELARFQLVVKKREPNCPVKYHVGMIVFHKLYKYRCVVYGWDRECLQSPEWMAHMNVNKLARKNKQPFYHVLANDGSERYAAEDNLVQINLSLVKIEHTSIGRYFSSFSGIHYELNKTKRAEYPDDLPYALVDLSDR